MTVRFANRSEVARWDELVLANPDGGQVWRGVDYAEQKKLGHYHPRLVMVHDIAVTVHVKKVPGLGQLWYLPKGPGASTAQGVVDIVGELAPFAKSNGAFALKIEPAVPATEDGRALLVKAGFLPTLPVIPNPSTILLDISAESDAVLAGLGQKARYSIKRAIRDGVTVDRVPATDENCRVMYDLLAATADGQFGIRSYEYYSSFWKRFEASGNGQLFFARFEGAVVAAAFAMKLGDRSTYKDGASIRQRTAYGASHLLQWEVISWAKDNGCVQHDLCGAPPSDKLDDTEHPLYGIGLFKTSFSKVITDYIGAYDLPLKPSVYRIWVRFAEKVARRLSLAVRHDPYY